MGGNKKGQRTKGNLHPSNSGRTAQLLTATGSSGAGFIGFDEVASIIPGCVPPSGQTADDADTAVDGDFRMVLRKMGKRDVTTKLKAVQEFAELCSCKEEDAVKGVVPYWPRLYNKLSLDHDRRIREATHQAHEQFVLKVRRSLAPQLHLIMGTWLVSQCDPYAPVASAAKSSFRAAFPSTKCAEALAYCLEDIYKFLKDVLFHQTPQTMSDPKSTAAEDMESKYCRVIACSLQGLRLLLISLPKPELEKSVNRLSEIVAEGKFWKYAKHKDSLVRTAWYSLIAMICQCSPIVIVPWASKLCPVTLGCLAESEPILSHAIWEAALNTMEAIPEWWKHINWTKAVLPQLWTVLREGGMGNAAIIFPNLPRFLAALPANIAEDRTKFYELFFSNLQQGLESQRVQKTPSECNAVIQAYLECVKFILVNSKELSSESEAVVSHLVIDQLVSLLESSLIDQQSALSASNLYPLLGGLLYSLEHSTGTSDASRDLPTYFWNNLLPTCLSILNDNSDLQQEKLNRLTSLVLCIHGVQSTARSRQTRVKFSRSLSSGPSLDCITVAQGSQCSNMGHGDSRRTFHPSGPVISNTYVVCSTALDRLQCNFSLSLLRFFSQLVVALPSPELFSHLLLGTKLTITDQNLAPQLFFDTVVTPWMQLRDVDDRPAYFSCLVDTVWGVCSCIDAKSKESILNMLIKTDDPLFLECIIRKVAESDDIAVSRWLQGTEAGEMVVKLARRLCQLSLAKANCKSENDSLWRCLRYCLHTTHSFEPKISEAHMGQVLEIFRVALQNSEAFEMGQVSEVTQVVEFVCDIASSLFSTVKGCWQLTATEDLLLALFLLSCQTRNCLPATLNERIMVTWEKGVAQLVRRTGGFLGERSFLLRMAAAAHEIIMDQSNSLTLDSIKSVSSCMLRLISTVYDALPREEGPLWPAILHPVVAGLTAAMLPNQDEWTTMEHELQDQFMQLPADVGYQLPLSCYYVSSSLCPSLPHFLSAMLMAGQIMIGLLCLGTTEEEEGNNMHNGCQTEVESKILVATLPHLSLAYIFSEFVADQVKTGMQVGTGATDWVGFCKELQACFLCLIERVPKADVSEILNYVAGKCEPRSILWSKALGCLLIHLKDAGRNVEDWCNNFMEDTQLVGVPNVCLLETVVPFGSSQAIRDLLSLSANLLVCLEDPATNPGGAGTISLIAICTDHLMQLSGVLPDDLGTVLEFLHGLKQMQSLIFACDIDLTSCACNQINFNSAMARFFTSVIKHMPQMLTSQHWDMILCTLVGWFQSLKKSQHAVSCMVPVLTLGSRAASLLTTLASMLTDLDSDHPIMTLPPNLAVEWKQFFGHSIYLLVVPMFVDLAEAASEKNSYPAMLTHLLEEMAQALHWTTWDNLMAIKIPTKGKVESCSLPTEVASLLHALYPLLTSKMRSVQLGAHSMLLTAMPHLPSLITSAEAKDEEECLRPPPSAMEVVLKETNNIMEAMLSDFQPGTCCLVQPYTDAYTYAMAYLLVWMELLQFFISASSEARSEYAEYLQSAGLLQNLLSNLFCLMPEVPTLPSVAIDKTKSLHTNQTMFTEVLKLKVRGDAVSHLELQHLACQVYLSALQKLPALVRQWWNNQDKRTADIIDQFTSKYVSGLICSQEIRVVHSADRKFKNLKVKARPMAREVFATYSVEEVSIELVIQLPPNHPLGIVSVESGRHVGVGNTQWRNWMLQLITFLTHQNGSIVDGLALWKGNVDKLFEGVEECMICFYVLHGSTCQLPRLTCRTCKKKFHSACLYKWFSTSNNSTCPLCRNIF